MELKIEKRTDGLLQTEHNGKNIVVRTQTCYPWSNPRQYISLRDEDDNEVAMIENLTDLSDDSRRVIEQSLAESAFVMEIEAVFSRAEEFEIRTWEVRTKQGNRKFQTKRDEWPEIMPDGSLLIRDVAGDLFRIINPNQMDAKSRKHLAPFID